MIVPLSARYRPARTFIKVDFPAPFSPSKAWISPWRSSKSTMSLANPPGNHLNILRVSRAKTSLMILLGRDSAPETQFVLVHHRPKQADIGLRLGHQQPEKGSVPQ